MKTITFAKHWAFAISSLTLMCMAACTKTSTKAESDYGCDSKVVLETLTNTPGILVYNPTQAEWQVSIDLGSNRKFSCIFCDKSAYSAMVAGQSTSSSIPVNVSGSVKRRVENQVPITPTTGYVEVYVFSATSVN
ncbi:MAG: hypothetical protein IPL54_03975 [Chitinophagaceae bacterium]|nr:hypothetical protein [Chitinophagaceae bacterium]